MIANVALGVGADVEKIKAAKTGSRTIAEDISETIAKIGENMTLRRAAELSVGKGAVGSYVHNAVIEGAGKMGVLVALESTARPRSLPRSAGCSRCMSLRPIRRRSTPPVTIRRW